MRAPEGNFPAGRLPITTISQFTPEGRFCATERISDVMVSSSTARFRARTQRLLESLHLCHRRGPDVDFMLADSGMEFTEVPPRITPILNVVLGAVGTVVAAKVSMALPKITIGLGAPKSLHECPPGPRTMTSKRRLPKASATIVSAPAPSSTSVWAIEFFPARRGKDVPHPSEIAFSLFANIANEHERQGMADAHRSQQRGDRQHRHNSSSVVGDAWPVNAASLLANVEWSIGRKHRIDVRGERNIAPPKPRMRAEDIADIVDANIVQPDLAKALL